MRATVLSACALLGASCAGSISGEVDGESVPGFTTAALAAVEQPGGDAVALVAYFATAGEACSLLTQVLEIQIDEEDPEDEAKKLEDLYQDSTPEEFWYATVSIIADDADDLEDEQEVDLEDFDEDVRGSLQVCHRENYPEEKDGFLDVDDDCYMAEDGVLRVTYAEEDALSIDTEKEIDLEDDDGDNAGEITISGRARYCKSLSDAYEDLLDDVGPPVDSGGSCSFSSDCQIAEMSDGSCSSSDDCASDSRCVLTSNDAGACLLVVDDSLICEDAGLQQSFFSSVEGTSVATCVSFDTFCDQGTCIF